MSFAFADEFPNDNPELFVARPLTALHLAAIRAARPEAPAFADEIPVEPTVAHVVADEIAIEPTVAHVVVDEIPVEHEDIEVVDAFDDSDFEHATLESIPPPPSATFAAPDVLQTEASIATREVEVVPVPVPRHTESSEALALMAAAAVDLGAQDSDGALEVTFAGEADRAARADVLVGADGDAILDPPAPEESLVSLASELDYASLWIDTLRAVAVAHGADEGAVAAITSQLATDPVAQAWRIAITGGEADFSVCGAQTLDEWCAHLIARAAGAPAKIEPIRRDLRSRGVCAFGLVVDAA